MPKELSAITWGEGLRKAFPLSGVLAFLIMSMCDIDREREIRNRHVCPGRPRRPRFSAWADAHGSDRCPRWTRPGARARGCLPGHRAESGQAEGWGWGWGMSLPNFRRTGCCGLVRTPGQGEWSPETQDGNHLQKQLLAADRIKLHGSLPFSYLPVVLPLMFVFRARALSQ